MKLTDGVGRKEDCLLDFPALSLCPCEVRGSTCQVSQRKALASGMTEQIINAFGLLRATVPRAESKCGVKGTWLQPASRHSSFLPGRQVEERNLQIYSNVAPLLAAGELDPREVDPAAGICSGSGRAQIFFIVHFIGLRLRIPFRLCKAAQSLAGDVLSQASPVREIYCLSQDCVQEIYLIGNRATRAKKKPPPGTTSAEGHLRDGFGIFHRG